MEIGWPKDRKGNLKRVPGNASIREGADESANATLLQQTFIRSAGSTLLAINNKDGTCRRVDEVIAVTLHAPTRPFTIITVLA